MTFHVLRHGELRDVRPVDDANDNAVIEHRYLLQVVLAQHAAYHGQTIVDIYANDAHMRNGGDRLLHQAIQALFESCGIGATH